MARRYLQTTLPIRVAVDAITSEGGMSAQLQQLSIFDLQSGIRGRDAGIERVISNNECFSSTMRGIARLIARRKGIVSSDDLREMASAYGIRPNHENAWGGIFRGNEWQAVGFIQSALPSNHGRFVRSWKLKV